MIQPYYWLSYSVRRSWESGEQEIIAGESAIPSAANRTAAIATAAFCLIAEGNESVLFIFL